jgi:secreted trypsin-like serine protease
VRKLEVAFDSTRDRICASSSSTHRYSLNLYFYFSFFGFSSPAAHCFQRKYTYTGDRRPAQHITAWVGKQNLYRTDEQAAVPHKVWDVFLHEGWKFESNDFDGDISLVVLESRVDLSLPYTVGVVCLPPASENEVSGLGTIVGWGISEWSIANEEPHSITPNELQLPTVLKSQCFDADFNFKIISSPRTFCAGFLNQNKSACKGDSGGGFYVYDESQQNFNLAGIVSASLKSSSAKTCRVDTYSVFTDVSKFIGWIEDKVEETKEIKWKEVDFECWEQRFSGR